MKVSARQIFGAETSVSEVRASHPLPVSTAHAQLHSEVGLT